MARLLIIEDSLELVEVYKSFLDEFELVFSIEQKEIEDLIDQVDLVICDYHFNPSLSFEQVRDLIGDRKPLILCSGEDDKVCQYGGIPKIEAAKRLKPMIFSLLKQPPILEVR